MIINSCIVHPINQPYFIIDENYVNVAKSISKKNFACIAALLYVYEKGVNNSNIQEWKDISQPCSSDYFEDCFFGHFSDSAIAYSFQKLIRSGCLYYFDKSKQSVVFDVLQVQSLICSSNKEYFTT